MLTKLNRNFINTRKSSYSNNVKTFTGFYSDSWTASTSSSASWSSLAINEDGLILAIASSNTINYSNDGGVTWTNITGITASSMKSIAYAKDPSDGIPKFVIVGYSFIMYSNKKNPISSSDWFTTGITTEYRPGLFSSSFPSYQWEDIVYNGGLFIAVSSNITTFQGLNQNLKRVAISRDGKNWRLDTFPFSYGSITTHSWKTVTYGNGTFIAAASSTDSGVTRLIYSNNDGNTWQESRSSVLNLNIHKNDNSWQDSTYSPKLNLFIVVANSGPQRLIYSSDGQNWSNEGISSSINTLDLSSICWSPELEMFVAIASGTTSPRFITSSNGINWTLRVFPVSSKSIISVIWNKKHNNFIGCSNATAATNNIFITKPLGIDSLPDTIDRYFNNTEISEFSYLNSNQESIEMISNADFGISPNININIHNKYTLDIPFPNGINLNPFNGVIYGKIPNNQNEDIIRIITVINEVTNKTLSTTIKIKKIDGKPSIDQFYYVERGSNNRVEGEFKVSIESLGFFLPFIDGSSPFYYNIVSTTADNGVFNFNSSNGELKLNKDKVFNILEFNIIIGVYNTFDEYKQIEINFIFFKRIIVDSFRYEIATSSVSYKRNETRYLLSTPDGFVQLLPYTVTVVKTMTITKNILSSYNNRYMSTIRPQQLTINNFTFTLYFIEFIKFTNDGIPSEKEGWKQIYADSASPKNLKNGEFFYITTDKDIKNKVFYVKIFNQLLDFNNFEKIEYAGTIYYRINYNFPSINISSLEVFFT